ncbi:hypothetical protein MSPP1_001225 [Malassezia sp. CBS 17886]|nr:hypothetical protein MSPP1_001225 [Malassezia sp. CBS 17886]
MRAPVAGLRAYPLAHALQAVLVLGILQPALVLLTLVDFSRITALAGSDALPARLLARVSRILRPGARGATDADALVWEMALALQGLVITQAWFSARFGSWSSVSEGHECGEPPAKARERRRSVQQQVQDVVLTSFSFPLLWLLALGVVFLAGAPLAPMKTLFGSALLAAHLVLLSLFPVVNVLGLPPSDAWSRRLAAPCSLGTREILLLLPAFGVWCGAWLSGALLALDWGRTWQTWPLPCIYGGACGLVVGNYVALGLCLIGFGDRRASEADMQISARAAAGTGRSTRRQRRVRNK